MSEEDWEDIGRDESCKTIVYHRQDSSSENTNWQELLDSTGPSHQLIQRLFDAIVDGRFDADAQQLVRSTKHVHVLFTILLPKLPLAFQIQVLQLFYHGLLQSTAANVLITAHLDLTPQLVEFLISTSPAEEITSLCVEILKAWSRYHSSRAGLQLMLTYCARNDSDSSQSIAIQDIFVDLVQSQTPPRMFYYFSGLHSGIPIGCVESLPEHGYSLHLEFSKMPILVSRIDPKIVLCSLRSKDGSGMQVYFQANQVWITVFETGGHEASSVCLVDQSHNLGPEQWLSLCLVHVSQSFWKGGDHILSYLNGQECIKTKLLYKNPSEPLYMTLAQASSNEDTVPFCGRIASVTLFDTALTPQEILFLHHRKVPAAAGVLLSASPKTHAPKEIVIYQTCSFNRAIGGFRALVPLLATCTVYAKCRQDHDEMYGVHRCLQCNPRFRYCYPISALNFVKLFQIMSSMVETWNDIVLLADVLKRLAPQYPSGMFTTVFLQVIDSFQQKNIVTHDQLVEFAFSFRPWDCASYDLQVDFLAQLSSWLIQSHCTLSTVAPFVFEILSVVSDQEIRTLFLQLLTQLLEDQDDSVCTWIPQMMDYFATQQDEIKLKDTMQWLSEAVLRDLEKSKPKFILHLKLDESIPWSHALSDRYSEPVRLDALTLVYRCWFAVHRLCLPSTYCASLSQSIETITNEMSHILFRMLLCQSPLVSSTALTEIRNPHMVTTILSALFGATPVLVCRSALGNLIQLSRDNQEQLFTISSVLPTCVALMSSFYHQRQCPPAEQLAVLDSLVELISTGLAFSTVDVPVYWRKYAMLEAIWSEKCSSAAPTCVPVPYFHHVLCRTISSLLTKDSKLIGVLRFLSDWLLDYAATDGTYLSIDTLLNLISSTMWLWMKHVHADEMMALDRWRAITLVLHLLSILERREELSTPWLCWANQGTCGLLNIGSVTCCAACGSSSLTESMVNRVMIVSCDKQNKTMQDIHLILLLFMMRFMALYRPNEAIPMELIRHFNKIGTIAEKQQWTGVVNLLGDIQTFLFQDTYHINWTQTQELFVQYRTTHVKHRLTPPPPPVQTTDAALASYKQKFLNEFYECNEIAQAESISLRDPVVRVKQQLIVSKSTGQDQRHLRKVLSRLRSGHTPWTSSRQYWKLDTRDGYERSRRRLLPSFYCTDYSTAALDCGLRTAGGLELSWAACSTPKERSQMISRTTSGDEAWSLVTTQAAARADDSKFSTEVTMVSMKGNVSGRLELTATELVFYGRTIIRKRKISEISRVLGRRYVLQHRALELFYSTRRKCDFFDFKSTETRNSVYRWLVNHSNRLHQSSWSFLSTNSTVPPMCPLTEWMRRWQNYEISTFDYLMALNTAAGRSFNDLGQYPIFPWILKDYASPVLDLASRDSYRDLSKPIGALNSTRLAKLKERATVLGEMDQDVPYFLYGSHYSSPGSVLYYLLRLEPYTQQAVQLQSGRFDHADRLFHSIQETWNNVLTSPSDVKELIPEFFTCRDFLLNHNQLPLGKCQNGTVVDHVELPEWANNDPDEFIRLHREALESDYVSAHLDEWINLIFGVAQYGKKAREHDNVFYHLTYEQEQKQLARIYPDGVPQQAIEAQISNFGQTPIQLFTFPHPKRSPRAKFSFTTSLIEQRAITQPLIRMWFISSHQLCHLDQHGQFSDLNLQRVTGLVYDCVVIDPESTVEIEDYLYPINVTTESSSFWTGWNRKESWMILIRDDAVVELLTLGSSGKRIQLDITADRVIQSQQYVVLIGREISIWRIVDLEQLLYDQRDAAAAQVRLVDHFESNITSVSVNEIADLICSASEKTCALHCLSTGDCLRILDPFQDIVQHCGLQLLSGTVSASTITKDGHVLLLLDIQPIETMYLSLYSVNGVLLKCICLAERIFPKLEILWHHSRQVVMYLTQASGKCIIRQLETLDCLSSTPTATAVPKDWIISSDRSTLAILADRDGWLRLFNIDVN